MDCNIKISKHAIEKYCIEMQKRKAVVIDAEQEIYELFKNAKLEKLNAGLIVRIIENNFEDTLFYKKGRWRFVICKDVMVTMEVDTFNSKYNGYIKKESLYRSKKAK